MLNREPQLKEEGYQLGRSLQALLPHQMWRIDLKVEEERPLRLVDETLLRLIEAGVRTRADLTRLMATEPDVAVVRGLSRLLKVGFLASKDGFQVTAEGRKAMRDQSMVCPVDYPNLQLRYDPWEDTFHWEIDEERIKTDGMHCLPTPAVLDEPGLNLRIGGVQALLEAKGLPSFIKNQQKVKRDVVDLRPLKQEIRYREATLEVWHREADDAWEVRVLYRGGESRAISEVVRRLLEQGRDLVPLEKAPPKPSMAGQEVAAAVEVAAAAGGAILQTKDHRDELRGQLERATRELLLISPWLTTDAVDGDLLGWLEKALKREAKLRIVVGYGIGDDPNRSRDPALQRKAADQKQAIASLQTLGRRFKDRLTLVEVGNTHQKILVRDRKEAVITSFNWLSFRPRPGQKVRLETGMRVTDLATVHELVRDLVLVLGQA